MTIPTRKIYFLGSSGIGKSTLINSVIAGGRRVVPSGGIGPFTAQAIEVEYGEKCSFSIRYKSKGIIESLIGSLSRPGRSIHTEVSAHRKESVNRERTRSRQGAPRLAVEDEDPKAQRILERKQAQLLIGGRQDAVLPTEYLLRGLRAVIEERSPVLTTFVAEDRKRIETLREVFNHGSSDHFEQDDPMYDESLEWHATGFLAPTVDSFVLRNDSPFLSNGVVLVDLPGIGIEGDVHGAVTKAQVKDKAETIVLVVTARGIGEAEHRLMRASGAYEGLFSSYFSFNEKQLRLVVAVTRVDDLAAGRYAHDPSKRKSVHLDDVRREATALVHDQVGRVMKAEWRRLERSCDPAAISAAIHEHIAVIPVSAIEHDKYHAKDGDDPSFVRDEEQSGIPALRRRLLTHC